MEERARVLGGAIEIVSRPRQGTTLHARVPARRPAAPTVDGPTALATDAEEPESLPAGK
jgi:hypothetical protein